MRSVLPTASFRLSALLSSPFQFTVPVYQRSYSWTVKEAGQLLEDLMTAAGVDGTGEGEPDYFLSSIVLLSSAEERDGTPKKAGARLFDIVDGQQRLITLTLLAAVLRGFEAPRSKLCTRLESLIFVNELAAPPEGPRLRVELRDRERGCFDQLVRTGVPSDDDPPSEDMLNVGETNLVAVRNHFVAELSQLDESERQQLSTYMCERCHFVVIFTGDIDRAHRMFTVLNERGRRLQRNDILKAEVLRRVAPGRQQQAALQWDLGNSLLGEEFEQFFSHLRSLHGKQKPQVVAGVRGIIDDVGGAERFLDQEFTPLASAYNLVLHASNTSLPIDEEIRQSLIYLGRLSGQDWVPAALLVLKLYPNDLPRARRLMDEIDRFAHLLRVLCLGNGKRVTRFNAVVDAIKAGGTIDRSTPAFRLSRDEVKAVAYNLRDLHRRNPQICKLALLRINDAMAGGMVAINPADATVEHVLPQRPKGASDWRQSFTNPEERAACAACLGNLVIVSPKQNNRARNQDFKRKQHVYGSPEVGAPLLAITREAVVAKSWQQRDIRAREARLVGILANLWRLDIDGAGAAASAA